MKKILLLLISVLLVASVLLSATSCDNGGGGSEGSGESGESGESGGGESGETITIYDDQTFYWSKSEVMFLTESSSGSRNSADLIIKALKKNVIGDEGNAFIGNIYMAQEYRDEVIVGYVADREISKKAYQLLERIDSKSPLTESRYLIYAEGGKIAIAYEDNPYSTIQSLEYVTNMFIEEYLSEEGVLMFDKGVVMSGVVDLITMQEQIDTVYVDSIWADYKQRWNDRYGSDDLYWAFRTYYSMFSDELPVWWANLYDPAIGCFYATPSGRDYEGFLPNPESMRQILGHISGSGALDTLCTSPGAVSKAMRDYLPKYLQAQMVYYCKAIQDPNGYFYLPQLGKEYTDTYAITRRGRDISSCVEVLSRFNEQPTWKTPTGNAGDGETAEEYWEKTGLPDSLKPVIPLMATASADKKTDKVAVALSDAVSIAVAASDVVAVSTDDSVAYMLDHSKFITYLQGKDIDAYPYSVGNELNSTYKQIEQYSIQAGGYTADKLKADYPNYMTDESGKVYVDIQFMESRELKKDAAGVDFVLRIKEGVTVSEILIMWISEQINDNGLFGDDYNPDTDDVLFQNTNGTMKIMPIYNNFRIPYPKAELAADGILTGIMSDEPSTGNICEVYNCWEALVGLINNVNDYITDEGYAKQVLDSIRDTLGEKGPAAVLNSYAKQSGYMKPHGTFSHSYVGGATSHQGGLPVGLGLDEGNVDAIGFGSNSIVTAMARCIGIDTFLDESIPESKRIEKVPLYTESDWMRFVDTIISLGPVIKYEYAGQDLPEIYDFEDGEIPEGNIRYNVKEPSEYEVIEMENGEETNKVLHVNKLSHFESPSSIAFTNFLVKKNGANMVYFSADILATNLTKRSELQIQFSNASKTSMANSQILFILSPAALTDGSAFRYTDYHNKKGAPGGNIDVGADVGKWFNLRVEIYPTEDLASFRYHIYINDTLAVVSSNVYSPMMVEGGALYSVDQFNYASLAMNKAFAGDFYFDNLCFGQAKKELKDTTLGVPDGFDPEAVGNLGPAGGSTGGSTGGGSGEGGGSTETPDGDKCEVVAPPTALTFGEMPESLVISYNDGNGDGDSADITPSIVDKDGDKTLQIDKREKDTAYLTFASTGDTKNPEAAVFTTDMFIDVSEEGSELAGLELYIRSGNSSAFGMLFSRSMSVCAYGGKDADKNNIVSEYYPTPIKTGEWFNLRVVAYVLDGATVYDLYVNGAHVMTGKLAFEGADTSISALSSVRLNVGAGNIGKFYFDNAAMFRSDLAGVSDYLPESRAKMASGATAPEYSTFDEMPADLSISYYDGNADGDSADISYAVVDKDGNKALHISKGEKDTMYLLWKVADNSAKSDVTVFDTDILIDSSASFANFEFYIRSGGKAAFFLYITKDGDKLRLQDYGAKGGTPGDPVTTKASIGEWFNLRVEVSVGSDGAKYDVYINGVLAMTGNRSRDVAISSAASVDEFRLNVSASSLGDYYVDNTAAFRAKAADLTRDLSNSRAELDASAPGGEGGEGGSDDEAGKPIVETFDGSDVPASVSVTSQSSDNTVTVVDKGEGNKALFINKPVGEKDSGNGTTISYTGEAYTEKDANVTVITFDLLIENNTGGNGIEIYPMVDSTKPYLIYLYANGENLCFKHNASGDEKVLGTVGSWLSFTVSYDSVAKSYTLTVGDAVIGIYTGTFKGAAAPAASAINKLNILFGEQTKAEYYLDNISISHLYDKNAGSNTPETPDVPEKVITSDGYGKVEADSAALDFSSMPTGNFSITGTSGSHKLEEITVGDEKESVLLVEKTTTGSMSVKRVGATVANAEANKVTFSADILVANVTSNSQLQFQFGAGKNTDKGMQYYAGLILLSLKGIEDGSALTYLAYDNAESAGETIELSAKVGEWFNFTVEYFEGALGEASYNVYVNGELVCNSTYIYSKHIHAGTEPIYDASEMDMLIISMNSNLIADVCYDNISIIQECVASSAD
ncbi:MAG: hypothetical protein IJY69_03630 [Clostridia bacterium]|nr:hypothetical protein [Clostridia bacterium]